MILAIIVVGAGKKMQNKNDNNYSIWDKIDDTTSILIELRHENPNERLQHTSTEIGRRNIHEHDMIQYIGVYSASALPFVHVHIYLLIHTHTLTFDWELHSVWQKLSRWHRAASHQKLVYRHQNWHVIYAMTRCAADYYPIYWLWYWIWWELNLKNKFAVVFTDIRWIKQKNYEFFIFMLW